MSREVTRSSPLKLTCTQLPDWLLSDLSIPLLVAQGKTPGSSFGISFPLLSHGQSGLHRHVDSNHLSPPPLLLSGPATITSHPGSLHPAWSLLLPSRPPVCSSCRASPAQAGDGHAHKSRSAGCALGFCGAQTARPSTVVLHVAARRILLRHRPARAVFHWSCPTATHLTRRENSSLTTAWQAPQEVAPSCLSPWAHWAQRHSLPAHACSQPVAFAPAVPSTWDSALSGSPPPHR